MKYTAPFSVSMLSAISSCKTSTQSLLASSYCHRLVSHAGSPSAVGSAMAGLSLLALFLSPLIGLPVSGFPSPALNLGGGVRTLRPSAGRERTTRLWMAQDTQYSIFM
jgi:hypothetical protein